MSRSLKVAKQHIDAVKQRLKLKGFRTQQELADELQIARSTVNNFLNGKPVDATTFEECCFALDYKVAEIAENAYELNQISNEQNLCNTNQSNRQDQWDLYLGSDLPAFMESGLSEVDRVIAICSENYVEKAPFQNRDSAIATKTLLRKAQYISVADEGVVQFNYENNNGTYRIGSGESLFDIRFSNGSNSAIHIYNDPANIEGIALSEESEFCTVGDVTNLDYTSRVRTAHLGQIVSLANTNGYFALIKIEAIQARSHGANESMVKFSYKINTPKNSIFE